MEMKRSSPNVVARLMGLDPLPPVAHKQQQESNFQKGTSATSPERHTSYKSYSLRTRRNEYQECKDVFEIMELPKTGKQHNEHFRKGISNSKHTDIDLKKSEIDWFLAKQKATIANDLSTDGEFRYLKEYIDSREDLDPNKDPLLKISQEHNSLFSNYVEDLKCDPTSPHASHITISKSSKVTTLGHELRCASQRHSERSCDLLKSDLRFIRNHVIKHDSPFVKEDSCSFLPKLAEPLYAGKSRRQIQHSEIVVLKPNLGKVMEMATIIPPATSPETCQDGPRKQKQISVSRRTEVYAEMRGRHKLSHSKEVMEHKKKGLRELAREITKQLRTDQSSGSKMVSAPTNYGYFVDESSHITAGSSKSQLLQWASEHLNDSIGSLSASAYYSSEPSASREARKRLSERRKMTQQMQEKGFVGRGYSTLGEMLVSDKETPRRSWNMPKNVPNGKKASNEVLARWEWENPSGISSMDSWKDGRTRSLQRSKSLPSSSLVYGNHFSGKNNVGSNHNSYPQNASNKSLNDSIDRNIGRRRQFLAESWQNNQIKDRYYSGREESDLSEREIHVNSEVLHDRIDVQHLEEEAFMITEFPNNTISCRRHEGGNLALQCKDGEFSLLLNAQQMQQSTRLAVSSNNEEFSCSDPHVAEKLQIFSTKHPQTPMHYNIYRSPPVSFKESDQPSPVSVLDPPPSEEDKSSSECFEKTSADLKELLMQLKLLKLEVTETDTEDLELHMSSDDDIRGECSLLEAFKDDDDRDFSYLLDVLIDSDVYRTIGNKLYNACYLPKYPLGTEMFEKLEKKYNMLVSWLRSERKLLFDLINSILANPFTLYVDQRSMKPRWCQPSWDRESLVEEVWQMVVKQRKEPSCKLEEKLLFEPRWLDLGDIVNMLGVELERMVIQDLMEEIFASNHWKSSLL